LADLGRSGLVASSSRRPTGTPPFPYSRPTFAGSKTVFNLVICDNDFEKAFARFPRMRPTWRPSPIGKLQSTEFADLLVFAPAR
jgi:hypothetical protein